MKSLFRFLRRPWLLSLLGLLAVAALIWLLGPLLTFAGREPLATPEQRIIAILLVALFWSLNRLRRYLALRRRNDAMLDGLTREAATPAAPTPGTLESDEELATLRERFDEAVTVLKQSRTGRRLGRNVLYELPWYVIVGPPGSGKTTALVNSGLEFPLAERFGQDAVRGVGGTRNCDWWFTDQAVLLDTAGRYTTQDSYQSVDQAAWTGFLGLLKKYRPRRPINGVLVAVSLPDLLRQGEADRSLHARAIRQRVQELHQQLGIRFPVYFLFTKTDLVAGFMEYFADLGREDRSQVWGCTFPLEEQVQPGGPVRHFGASFAALQQRLNARLVERLQQERDPARRALIHGFPQQFGSLKGVLERFLGELFQPSRYEETALLRGVYFTSGTQEGSPIDRVMGALAQGFGLDRQALPAFAGHGQSFFLGRLFRDLMFREAELAGANLRLERRRSWLQRAAYAGLAAVTTLAIGAWVLSYSGNQAYVTEVDGRVQDLRRELAALTPQQREPLATLATLDTVQALAKAGADGAPWSLSFGLYQGEKLGAAAQGVYERLLRRLFLPRVMLRLEDQIRGALGQPDFLYQTLRVYLMFDDPEHFDSEVIRAWMGLDWEHNLPRRVTAEERGRLAAHLAAATAQPLEQAPIPLDQNLVRRARDVLLRLPLAERIYAGIKEEPLGDKLPPFRISEAGGPDAALVFVRRSGKPLSEGVPGLFTYRGYYQGFLAQAPRLVQRAAAQNWVLGPSAPLADPTRLERLVGEVRQLYLAEYIRQWDELLGDIAIRSTASAQQSVEVLRVLSGPDSPLRQLLGAAAAELDLQRVPVVDPGLVDQAAEKVSALRGELARFFGPDQVAPERPAEPEENPVNRHFARLIALVQHAGDRPAPIEALLASLNELYAYQSAIASAADRGGAALEAARSQQMGAGNVVAKVRLEAQRLPLPVQGWVTSMAQDSSGKIVGGVRQHLNSLWTANVVPFYRQALAGRYPLVRGSPQEATLEDFGTFFGPNGLVDDFFKNYLASFVDTSRRTWRWQGGSMRLGIGNDTLAQLQRAAEIRQAFFTGSGATPSVAFNMLPLELDAQAKQFLLDLEGQTLDYRHGPTRPSRLQWPAPQSSGQVRVVFVGLDDSRPSLTEQGPWAWFRMLDRARTQQDAVADRFQVTFQVDRYRASFQLQATSVRNPFRLEVLQAFRCPERL